MSKQIIYLLLFFNVTLYGQIGNFANKAIPTFNGSSINLSNQDKLKDIYNKTQLHISNKVDSLFIKRMKLKENDSIEFKFSYLIDKYGVAIADSTKINTGIPSFDNYIKLIVGTLPKFTPAIDLTNNINCKYRVQMFSEFIVKNNKLMIYKNNKTSDFKELIYPILEACDTKSSKALMIECTSDLLTKTIISKLNQGNIPDDINTIKVMVDFIINDQGKATEIKLIQSSCQNSYFIKDFISIFSDLPKFSILTKNNTTTNREYLISLTLSFKRREKYRDDSYLPYRPKRFSKSSQ